MTRVSGSSRGRGCNLARRMCRQEKGGGGILSCFRFFDLPNGVHWVNGTDGNSTEGMYVCTRLGFDDVHQQAHWVSQYTTVKGSSLLAVRSSKSRLAQCVSYRLNIFTSWSGSVPFKTLPAPQSYIHLYLDTQPSSSNRISR